MQPLSWLGKLFSKAVVWSCFLEDKKRTKEVKGREWKGREERRREKGRGRGREGEGWALEYVD